MLTTLTSGRTITLRLGVASDGEALGAMLERCSARTYRFFHPYPLTRESGLKVAADEGIVCIIAFAEDGAAVGYAWIGRAETIPSLGICVRDDWQDRGVGRALLECVLAEARGLGKAGVQLTVMKDNARALHLYQRLGFVSDGDAPDPMGPSYHMILRFE